MTDPIFCFPSDLRPIPDIFNGDCLAVLRDLPANSIDCCVTSPPFYGLRDYQTGSWQGGDPLCLHAAKRGTNVKQTKHPNADAYPASAPHRGGDSSKCLDCGALRVDDQIGLESTPALYVAKLVKVFAEVRRVLKPEGTLWLNLGDSYANDGKWGGASGGKHVKDLHGASGIGRSRVTTGLKSKDLIGIPWRAAFALQDDGWYIRSDIIWHKPNVMPESVNDRPTSSYEHVFLLTKNPHYYYDAIAIREDSSQVQATVARNTRADKGLVGAAALYGDGFGQSGNGGFERAKVETRNARNVWSINTKPYKGAHFATMPLALVERCIRAGSSEQGVCPQCGAAWVRVVERGESDYARLGKHNGVDFGLHDSQPGNSGQTRKANGTVPSLRAATTRTTGWEATCGCAAHDAVPSTVLDPFGGSGTTGVAAQRLGRRAVLIELNSNYVDLALHRISNEKS